MHSLFGLFARKPLSALLLCTAVLAAGCHHNNNTSGYGIGWVTLTDEPADFTSYIVTVDSVVLTGQTVGSITAVSAPEIIDFAKLSDISELWSSASIPNDTYTSATITLDYTNAVISVLVNGQSQKATVTNTAGAAVTTVAVTVNFDPSNRLIITPTYASTSAERLAINFNLPASNQVVAGTTPTVLVRPFLTIGTRPADTKLIRVRGPLINSSLTTAATGAPAGDSGTYTVYVRPFYDEVDSLGSLTLFNTKSTVYTINGTTYVGSAGITAMSQLSAGSTMTAAYTTFTPTVNNLPSPPSTAGVFYPLYVVAGSTLEDNYTEGLTGYVTSRSGNTLTLSGSTVVLNTAATFNYPNATTQLLVGPQTTVTIDGNSTLTGLNSDSIAVGQYVFARGIYSQAASGAVTVDATGSSSTNTGSVRLLPTPIWGSLVSSASGSLVMNVQTINNWPASSYSFAGNGTGAAQTPSPAAFAVDTGTLTVPSGVVAGNSLWITGNMSPFGSAPPDFNAFTIDSEASVQVAGGNGAPAGTQGCGVGSQVCQQASMQVVWSSTPGTTTPFVGFGNAGFTINLSNAQLATAVIRIGPESINMKTLAVNPAVEPTSLPVSTTFSPLYAVGNPTTASTTPAANATTAISVYSDFPSFVTQVNTAMTTASPAVQFEARGLYNRTANTFTATSINLVL